MGLIRLYHFFFQPKPQNSCIWNVFQRNKIGNVIECLLPHQFSPCGSLRHAFQRQQFMQKAFLVIWSEYQYRASKSYVLRRVRFVKCVLQPKSGGVIERTPEYRAEARRKATRSYFYGPRGKLYPHTFDVKIADGKASFSSSQT